MKLSKVLIMCQLQERGFFSHFRRGETKSNESHQTVSVLTCTQVTPNTPSKDKTISTEVQTEYLPNLEYFLGKISSEESINGSILRICQYFGETHKSTFTHFSPLQPSHIAKKIRK